MGQTIRFGVSMDNNLVELLDKLAIRGGHSNRSETLRELVRKELIDESSMTEEREVVGTVVLIFHVGTRLPRAPVAAYPSVRITTNIQTHVDVDICVKVLVVHGRGDEVRSWARKLISHRNVIGRLHIAATDELFRELRKQ
jgi:CopG family transcriptional regulator, nickel-responsive regulator